MKVPVRHYNFLLFSAVLIMGLSFMFSDTVDVHFYDTYYILPAPIFLAPFCLLLSVSWLIYRWTNGRLLSTALTKIHIITTLFSTIAFLLLPLIHRYFDLSAPWAGYNRFNKVNMLFSTVFLAFLIAQFLFIINLIGSIVFTILRLTKASKKSG